MADFSTTAPVSDVLELSGITQAEFDNGLNEEQQIKFDKAYLELIQKNRGENNG